MIARLLTCFGWWGLLSVLAWLAALVLGAAAWRASGSRRLVWAAVLALAGVLLAGVQTCWWRAIPLDRSDEERALREVQLRQQAQEEQARRASGEHVVRFAEDVAGEAVGSAILTADELSGRNGARATNDVPGYLAGGRQARAAGSIDARAVRLARDVVGDRPAVAVRCLKLADYRFAARLARANRLLSTLTLLFALGLVVVRYLRDFDQHAADLPPLPLAGTWLAHFSHGPRRVVWRQASVEQLRAFLETTVRKGEPFVYVGDRLAAVDIRDTRIRLGPFGFWSRRVLTWGRDGVPRDAEFALDAVWFNRYSMVVPVADAANLPAAWIKLLTDRAATHAMAERLLPHLVWDAPIPPADAKVWQHLGVLCERTGMRLVLAGEAPPSELQASFVEQVEADRPWKSNKWDKATATKVIA